ncbi:MAG: hypothetical protein AB7T32_15320 [Dehalococcoidia bacterium]
MVVLIALYVCALAGSVAFFIWSAGTYFSRKRRLHRVLNLELGPESEPAVFALYCQYLVAPQTAVREAQNALTLVRHRAAAAPSSGDFFVLLEQLQSSLPASARSR